MSLGVGRCELIYSSASNALTSILLSECWSAFLWKFLGNPSSKILEGSIFEKLITGNFCSGTYATGRVPHFRFCESYFFLNFTVFVPGSSKDGDELSELSREFDCSRPVFSDLLESIEGLCFSSLDLVVLFDCLNTSNSQQIRTTCDVLLFLLDFIDPVNVLERWVKCSVFCHPPVRFNSVPSRSVTFWKGSVDPDAYLWLTDLDPDPTVQWPTRNQQRIILFQFFCLLLLKRPATSFLKDNKSYEVTKQ